jgi:uncharacterized phage-associated protein
MEVNIKDRKLVQVLAYVANKSNGNEINKLKAIKLVWAADRYHLRKYGRLVSGDEYYALKYGPVASQIKDIAEEDSFLPETYVKYSKQFIHPDAQKLKISAKQEADKDFLSATDIEALDFAWENFSKYTGFQLAKLSHEYPEWKKFEDLIESGELSRGKISLTDFFDEPNVSVKDDPFKIDDDILKYAKEIFIQNVDIERALTV